MVQRCLRPRTQTYLKISLSSMIRLNSFTIACETHTVRNASCQNSEVDLGRTRKPSQKLLTLLPDQRVTSIVAVVCIAQSIPAQLPLEEFVPVLRYGNFVDSVDAASPLSSKSSSPFLDDPCCRRSQQIFDEQQRPIFRKRELPKRTTVSGLLHGKSSLVADIEVVGCHFFCRVSFATYRSIHPKPLCSPGNDRCWAGGHGSAHVIDPCAALPRIHADETDS